MFRVRSIENYTSDTIIEDLPQKPTPVLDETLKESNSKKLYAIRYELPDGEMSLFVERIYAYSYEEARKIFNKQYKGRGFKCFDITEV